MRYPLAAIGAMIGTMGCANGPEGPAQVDLTVAHPVIGVGDATMMVATPRDAAGNELLIPTVSWESSNPAVVTVAGSGPTGSARGVAIGTAVVTATIDGTSNGAQVTVEAALVRSGGSWDGLVGSGNASFVFDLLLNETESGTIVGTGSGIRGTDPPVLLTIGGQRVHRAMSLTISIEGFAPLFMTGTYDGASIVGTLNGSGFNNAGIRFERRPG